MSVHRVYWSKTSEGLEQHDRRVDARTACRKANGGKVYTSTDDPDAEMIELEEVKGS